ncbi:hypothetical protein A2U01_0046470, partial [Trifolium medium]|nr:hypothetical protein [Trifolium medium]
MGGGRLVVVAGDGDMRWWSPAMEICGGGS